MGAPHPVLSTIGGVDFDVVGIEEGAGQFDIINGDALTSGVSYRSVVADVAPSHINGGLLVCCGCNVIAVLDPLVGVGDGVFLI